MNAERKRRILTSPSRLTPHASRHGVFITGTDTGVGKTLVTAALAVCLKQRGVTVGVMKPIETGSRDEGAAGSDAARLYAAAGMAETVEEISPYRFADPLAPAAAARRAGQTISLPHIVRSYRALAGRYDIVLVEGVGGAMVPLTAREDVRDLIRQIGLPVIVVGRAGLGAVNHARLTLEALRQRHIPVHALLLNRAGARSMTAPEELQEISTVSLLKSWGQVPVIGPLPHEAKVNGSWEEGLAAIANGPAIGALTDLIIERAKRTRVSPRPRPAHGRSRK
jgi:dethiobiotin synthetase